MPGTPSRRPGGKQPAEALRVKASEYVAQFPATIRLPASAAEDALIVPTTEGDADDHDFGGRHLERDAGATFEAYDAQARTQVVAAMSTMREGFERHAGGLEPIDVAARDVVASFLRDVAIEVEQIRFRERAEGDSTPCHCAKTSPVRRGDRGAV